MKVFIVFGAAGEQRFRAADTTNDLATVLLARQDRGERLGKRTCYSYISAALVIAYLLDSILLYMVTSRY